MKDRLLVRPGRHLSIPLAVILALLGNGCSSADKTTESAAASSLSGNVIQTGTSTGVAGAIVRAGSASYTTVADGSYSLTGLQAGTATVQVSATGFQAFSQSVELASGANILDVQLTSSIQNGVLVGFVRNAVGTPISGATVSVAGFSTTTDATGRYQFPAIPQGNQVLTVTAAGYVASSSTVLPFQANIQFDVVLRASTPSVTTGSASLIADSTIQVSWSAVQNTIPLQGLRLYRSKNTRDTTQFQFITQVSNSASTYTDRALSYGFYRYRLRAITADGVEGPSGLRDSVIVPAVFSETCESTPNSFWLTAPDVSFALPSIVSGGFMSAHACRINVATQTTLGSAEWYWGSVLPQIPVTKAGIRLDFQMQFVNKTTADPSYPTDTSYATAEFGPVFGVTRSWDGYVGAFIRGIGSTAFSTNFPPRPGFLNTWDAIQFAADDNTRLAQVGVNGFTLFAGTLPSGGRPVGAYALWSGVNRAIVIDNLIVHWWQYDWDK